MSIKVKVFLTIATVLILVGWLYPTWLFFVRVNKPPAVKPPGHTFVLETLYEETSTSGNFTIQRFTDGSVVCYVTTTKRNPNLTMPVFVRNLECVK